MADRKERVWLEAITGQYEAAMAKAGLSTKSLGHTVDSVSAASQKSFKSMALGLKDVGGGSLAAGAGIAVLGVAVTKFVREGVASYIHLVDEVRAYKNISGASAEESSRMVAVAHALGVENNTVANGVAMLSRRINTNRDGLESQGVSIAHNRKGNVDLNATLLNVADAYQRVGAGQAGNVVAQAAFGRSYRSMIPILKQGREELEGFWRTAESHGQIVTEADLKAVFDYKVSVRELGEAWAGLERKIAPGAVKALTFVAENSMRTIDGAERWAHDIGEGIDAAGDMARSLFGLSDGHKDAGDKALSDAEAQQSYADSVEEAARKTDEFLSSLDVLYARAFSVSEAQGKFNADLAEFADKVTAAKLAGDAHATSLDEGTASGHKNAEMVRGLTKDILDTAKAARVNGEDVTTATEMQRNALVNVLTQLGFNRVEAQKYADVLAGLAGLVVSSEVDLDISQAQAKLDQLREQYGDIVVGISRLDILDEHDKALVEAGRGVPDSIASPELYAARQRQAALNNTLPGSTAGAVAGQGPEAQAERERLAREREQRARDAAQSARDAQAEADRRKATEFEFGGISADDYKKYLRDRLAQTREFGSEWSDIMHEIARVNEQIGAGWKAAAEERQRLEDLWMTTISRQHELGERSNADYLKQLEERLKHLKKYSDEYMAVWREINQLKEETSQAELDIIAAVDKQRRFDQAFYAAADQRQLTAVRDVGIDYRQLAAAVGSGGRSTTYSPNFNIHSTDPVKSMETANQKMRDYAAAVG